jgi:O-antigen/teichoic acid export membrane protein
MTATLQTHLTSGRLLARNTLWNFLAQATPLLVAVVAFPVLIKNIGVARFGILSVAWMLIGYFGLFDFGIDEALVKMVADRLGTDAQNEIPSLVWTSLAILLTLGFVASVTLALLSPWLVNRVLNIPFALQRESLYAFFILSVGMPIAIVTSGFRGVLEAMQRFKVLTAIRIPLGTSTFIAPLLVLPFSHSLVPIVSALLVARLAGLVAHAQVTLSAMPALRHHLSLSYKLAKPVLHFGGWITISNIVSPAMANVDRFLIGALLSVTAVSYYAAPFEMVTKLFLLVAAIAPVIFPAFAISHISDRRRMTLLLTRGMKYMFLAAFPVVLIIVTLAPEGLRAWLGSNFAEQSSSVLRWLAFGVLINCLSVVVAVLVQAVGRPDVTAKFHLLELPAYLALVWWLIRTHGIEGAAWAWSARIALDALLLGAASALLLPETRAILVRSGMVLLASGGLLLAPTWMSGVLPRLAYLIFVLTILALTSWFVLLAPEERALIRAPMNLAS